MSTNKNPFENTKNLRVRIAPSPTGTLHVGTARTALFNYLTAKKYGGTFILRIEDTDLERSDVKFEQDILDNLKWLGINWDEGVGNGGTYGPYRQSERIEIYKKYIQKLLEENKAYHCFCTVAQLEAQKSDMIARGLAPIYSGACSRLSKQETEKRLKNNAPSIIRFRMPQEIISFHDLIRGKLSFDTKLIGDIAIAKNLTTPLYNFAVVIDDELMKISHVIRGEDHISNTPKQIALQKALGFNIPKYAHLPLLLGTDRSKLSKRHGATSIKEYKDQGYLPEAIINFTALLGWNPGTNEEIMNKEELITKFSFEKIQKSGAVFDIKKLDWINSIYIKKMSPDKFLEKALPYLETKGLIKKLDAENHITQKGQNVNNAWLKKVASLEQPRIKKFNEVGETTTFLFKDINYDVELLRWKNARNIDIKKSLEYSHDLISKILIEDFNKFSLEKILKDGAKKFDPQDAGALLWPLRVALSGQKTSPTPFDIMDILGKENTLGNIELAIKKLEE
jgi:glutamyl-tRNA synthetase